MSEVHEENAHNNEDRKEPSQKDPQAPAPSDDVSQGPKQGRPAPRNRREQRDALGKTSSQGAHASKNRVSAPMARTAKIAPEREEPATWAQDDDANDATPNRVIPTIVLVAILLGLSVVTFFSRMGRTHVSAPPVDSASHTASADLAQTRGTPLTDWIDPGPMGFAEIQKKHLIIDVHEHIESLAEASKFVKAMDQFGIQKICLMGSSEFTLTLNESLGFTGYDENNEELLKIVKAFPGRFEAWPTLSPTDPDKLKKIQDLIARGATGVKLYTGHGYETKKHEYIFHPVAMDDPAMLPFYAWCEENFIPIVLHVNPYSEKKGFAEEFVAVLTQFPNMKVVAPHFMLSTIKSNRLRELLDTFPNLYSDVSFGDFFMKERLLYISKEPGKFKKIFKDYPDRFMFATDLVMIKSRQDDWAPIQYKAYLDMLTKESYTSPAIPGVTLRGLNLSDDLLSRILFRNYEAFRQYRPINSKPRGEIDWKMMSVEPVDRKPGEAFPPSSK